MCIRNLISYVECLLQMSANKELFPMATSWWWCTGPPPQQLPAAEQQPCIAHWMILWLPWVSSSQWEILAAVLLLRASISLGSTVEWADTSVPGIHSYSLPLNSAILLAINSIYILHWESQYQTVKSSNCLRRITLRRPLTMPAWLYVFKYYTCGAMSSLPKTCIASVIDNKVGAKRMWNHFSMSALQKHICRTLMYSGTYNTFCRKTKMN